MDKIEGLENKVWMDAAKRLSLSAFEIYLYLVSNNGNIQKLSPKDIENSLGIKRATYYEALGKLEEAGYLYREDGALKFRTSLFGKEKVIFITEEQAKTFGKLSLWGIRVWVFSHFNHGVVSPQEVLDWYGITTDCRKNVRAGIQDLENNGLIER